MDGPTSTRRFALRSAATRRHATLTALACAISACTVALEPSPAPRVSVPALRMTTPAPRPTLTPTPQPTLVHLSKLAYPNDDGSAEAAAPLAEMPLAATAPTPAAEVPPVTAPPVAVPAAPVAAPVASNPVPLAGTLTFERHGALLSGAARIGDRPIGDVLLDTSAGAVFLDRTVAEAAQLRDPLTASTEDTPGDRDDMRELSGLTLGGVPLAAERAFVVDLGATDLLVGSRLAGVIGLSAFDTAPFTLDVRNATLTVHSNTTFEPPAGVSAEALRIDQGLPFVEATLADGTRVWLLLDTGSPATISVWRGFAKQHPGVVKPMAGAQAGDPTVPTSELRGVGLFGGRYERVPITIETGTPRLWERSRVVGRVGMGLLRNFRITVHPSTERLWAERVAPTADH